MKEIKFRAWDKDGEQWLEEDQFMIYPNGTVSAWIEEDEVKNVEITQYTGLKDRNLKEIYEGDIIKNYNRIEQVRDFGHSPFCWTDGISGESLFDPSESEVIGNIYENPELLK